MQSEEQRLIDGLFQRLKQAEQRAGPRDAEAERLIQDFIQQQPAAPYYMAQSMLIQEAALNRLNQQVQQLQNDVARLRESQQSASGGFLSGLLGGGRSQPSPQPQVPTPSPGYTGSAPSSNAPRGGSFMSGALQTAAGVAGGVVLGNMLTNMFHHSVPEEIVNIIDDPTASMVGGSDPLLSQSFDAGNLETFNHVSDRHFLDQNDTLSNNEWGADDFSHDDDGFL
ncbi:DUF2076 domain-containing protein [Sodalis endosymbiont of Spalangia cameroni]|uniref:DUF2076 domain-containing protein n=1 Tax=Sodalis praecaptivus TaxID=1239307 RepID=UPI0031F99ABF